MATRFNFGTSHSCKLPNTHDGNNLFAIWDESVTPTKVVIVTESQVRNGTTGVVDFDRAQKYMKDWVLQSMEQYDAPEGIEVTSGMKFELEDQGRIGVVLFKTGTKTVAAFYNGVEWESFECRDESVRNGFLPSNTTIPSPESLITIAGEALGTIINNSMTGLIGQN